MPRYYCDYCDTYLTHDSASVRKQHNAGYKHKANVRTYYQQFEEQQTQSFIDQKVKEHLGQTYQQQVGVAFHNVIQLGQYKPAILPPPALAVPGTIPASGSPILQAMRPPVLPRPSGLLPAGYAMAPTLRPPGAPIGPVTAQTNGLPRPLILLPPGAQVSTSSPVSANGPVPAGAPPGPPGGPPNAFQQLQSSNSSYVSFPYGAPPVNYPQQQPHIAPSPASAVVPPPVSIAASASLAAPTSADSTQGPNSSQQPCALVPTSGPVLSSGPMPLGNYGYGQSIPGPLSSQVTPAFASSPEAVADI